MNKNTVGMACKWTSVVLVFLSLAMFFTGWLSLRGGYKDEFKDRFREVKKSLNVDKDQIEQAEEELEEYGVEINLKKLIKQTKGIFDMLKDGEISPSEIAITGPTILDWVKAMEEIEDEMPSYLLGNEMDEIMDMVEQVKGGMTALIVLFCVTIVVGVLVIALHIMDKPFIGISPVIFSVIWWIVLGIASHKINEYTEDELGRALFELTPSPIWAFLFAVLAAAIWMFRDTIVSIVLTKSGVVSTGVPVTSGMTPGEAVPNGKKCPTCGKILKAEAVFCPACGNKFEEPEEKRVDIADDKTRIYSRNTEEEANKEEPVKITCGNCGAELAAEAMFCPKCGAKR